MLREVPPLASWRASGLPWQSRVGGRRQLNERTANSRGVGQTSDNEVSTRASALIESLYQNHFTDLCKNIHKSFGAGPPEPQDVVHAAFAKFAGLEDPTKIEEPRSFLFITARNIVLDHKRRTKTSNAYIAEQMALDHELKLEGITPERVVLAKDYFERLIAAIETLPRKQKIVLSMNRLEGKTYQQIQDETGWSAGSVGRAMSAGMDALLRKMEGDGTGAEIARRRIADHSGAKE